MLVVMLGRATFATVLMLMMMMVMMNVCHNFIRFLIFGCKVTAHDVQLSCKVLESERITQCQQHLMTHEVYFGRFLKHINFILDNDRTAAGV